MERPANCPKVTVLVCTLNEEANLPHVLPKIPDWVDEILLVDGHSTDRTVEIGKAVRPDARVLLQPGSGKGDALRYGFSQARGDIVVTLDADGSMDPEEIPGFVSPLCAGYEFSKGSRFLGADLGSGTEDMERHRVFGNKLFLSLTNRLYGCSYTDLAYGYNAFRRRALEDIELVGDGFEIETEIMVKIRKANLKTIEVPSFERKRRHGTTNLKSFRDGCRILKVILRERLPGWILARQTTQADAETIRGAFSGLLRQMIGAGREDLP